MLRFDIQHTPRYNKKARIINQHMDEQTKKEFENLTQVVKTSFDEVDKKFVKVDKKFEEIGGRLDKIESGMATKNFIADKLADLEGGVITRQKSRTQKSIRSWVFSENGI